MKVTVIGSGSVAKALSKGFIGSGHYTDLITRHPENPELLNWRSTSLPTLEIKSYSDIDQSTDIFVLAVHWDVVMDAIDIIGSDTLTGKVVIDPINPINFQNGALSLMAHYPESAGQLIQQKIPQSQVVKAFNIIGNQNMYKPTLQTGTPDMLICGDNQEAKNTVSQILESFGWESVIDLGPIQNSFVLETLGLLWIKYRGITNTSTHAISILKD